MGFFRKQGIDPKAALDAERRQIDEQQASLFKETEKSVLKDLRKVIIPHDFKGACIANIECKPTSRLNSDTKSADFVVELEYAGVRLELKGSYALEKIPKDMGGSITKTYSSCTCYALGRDIGNVNYRRTANRPTFDYNYAEMTAEQLAEEIEEKGGTPRSGFLERLAEVVEEAQARPVISASDELKGSPSIDISADNDIETPGF